MKGDGSLWDSTSTNTSGREYNMPVHTAIYAVCLVCAPIIMAAVILAWLVWKIDENIIKPGMKTKGWVLDRFIYADWKKQGQNRETERL